MGNITRVGVDLAKLVIQVHAVDAGGKLVTNRQQIKRTACDLTPYSAYCRDPDDDKFIATALQAQADWLISGDNDLLEAHASDGLCILTPEQALCEMESRNYT